MKRIAGLLIFVLGSVMFVAAQDQDKDRDKAAATSDSKAGAMEMTGVICNAKCVKQDAGKASCDNTCKTKDGDVVFVDDQGKSFNIANQKMAKKHSGKQVKMKGAMKGEMIQVEQLVDLNPGPG
jgi:hypothetical protein